MYEINENNKVLVGCQLSDNKIFCSHMRTLNQSCLVQEKKCKE